MNPHTKRPHLLFSSTGNNPRVQRALHVNRSYDVWIAHYGENTPKWHENVEKFIFRKGGKYQNLQHFYRNFKSEFLQYDSIAVFDDDIEIANEKLERLFKLHRALNLKISQPAFLESGKISHKITARNVTTKYRYSNFVEEGCPVFETKFLAKFLESYHDSLIGYGIDLWFSSLLSNDPKSIALIDDIFVRNPLDHEKPSGLREIDKLLSPAKRVAAWEAVKVREKIELDVDRLEVLHLHYKSSLHRLFEPILQSLYTFFFKLLRTFSKTSSYIARTLTRFYF